jgi:hypothetical protein
MSAPRVKTQTPGIYRRGSKYSVVITGPDGRKRWRSCDTLAEARAAKSALTTDVRRGEYAALPRVRLGEFVDQWLEGYQGRTRNGVRPATVADYRKLLDRHASPTSAPGHC